METSNLKQPIRKGFTTKPSSTRLRADLAEGRAQQSALEAPFKAETYTQEAVDTRRAAQHRERTIRTWKRVVALGAVAIFGIFGAPKVAEEIAPSTTGHTYTQEELAGMNHRTVVVKPNEGAEQVILDVKANKKSDIFSNGPDLVAVEQFINDQEPGPLQPHEHVEVPILPHGQS